MLNVANYAYISYIIPDLRTVCRSICFGCSNNAIWNVCGYQLYLPLTSNCLQHSYRLIGCFSVCISNIGNM